MNAMLKLLENDLLSDETKKEISETFRSVLEEAKTEQEKTLRSEFAERYERDKEKIAEAVQQYIDQGVEKEMTEFRADWTALGEQRMKYVNAQAALKEQAQNAIRQRLAVFEKAMQRAFRNETKELHEDLKRNRSAALRAITETKAQSEADREALKTKGAKVLEHILKVQFDSERRAMKEDIDKAKQNDFGSRIFEAFMGEARRLFFSSHKELRNLLKKLNEQKQVHEAEKAALLKQVNETKTIAQRAISENRTIKESAIRAQKESRLLSTLPVAAREKMKMMLEASSVADLDKTFRKFAPEILSEARGVPSKKTQLSEHAVSFRGGNGHSAIVEDVEDDDEIANLRHRAGISSIVRK
jgi:hypothetical protein